jgi:hypothetical protein
MNPSRLTLCAVSAACTPEIIKKVEERQDACPPIASSSHANFWGLHNRLTLPFELQALWMPLFMRRRL